MEIIPLHLLAKYFDSRFKFYSNLHFQNGLLKNVPAFYKKILRNQKKYFTAPLVTPSCFLSKFFWYKSHIKTSNTSVHFQHFLTKCFDFFTHFFHFDGTIKNWNNLKIKFTLENNDPFSSLRLVIGFPEMWKK